MNINNHNNKKTICCICALVFLCTLVTNATMSSQIKATESKETVNLPGQPPPPVGRFGGRSSTTVYDQEAAEAYEKRNAEITPRAEDGTPPEPGNAALLYFQAFLLRPEPSKELNRTFYPGTEINNQVRTYIGQCLPVIEIAETASRMPQCTWLVTHERKLSRFAIRRELGALVDILLVDAKALAADGRYRVAFERCLTVRRIARQLSEDPQLYRYSTITDGHALRMLQHVLGVMPPDADTLTWLRGQLAVVQGAPPLFAKELQTHTKTELNHIRTQSSYLAMLRDLLVTQAKDEQAKDRARNLTDEQILLCTSERIQSHLDSIYQILDSKMTYQQKLAEMQTANNMVKADGADPVMKIISKVNNFEVITKSRYSYYIWHQAHINAVKAAVDIYLVVAKTGQLPETIPAGLPKDPSTNEDFIYKTTDEGFILRCGIDNYRHGRLEQYEFRVKNKN